MTRKVDPVTQHQAFDCDGPGCRARSHERPAVERDNWIHLRADVFFPDGRIVSALMDVCPGCSDQRTLRELVHHHIEHGAPRTRVTKAGERG